MLIEKERPGLGSQALSEGAQRDAATAMTRHNYRLSADRADIAVTDCVVVTMDSKGCLSNAATELDKLTSGLLSGLFDRGIATGKRGSTLLVPLSDKFPAKAVMLAGVGNVGLRDREFNALVQAVYAEFTATNIRDAAFYLTEIDVIERDDYWKIRQQIVALEAAAYCFLPGTRAEASRPQRDIILASEGEDLKPLKDGCAIAAAINTARALGDTPPNICTPTFLADFAVKIAEQYPSVSVEILNEQDMSLLGMGAMLSVGEASEQGSRFVVLSYSGADAAQRPFVLIGKGVTFDTGGTTLKTRQGMRLMKYDMCGAAVTMGALQAAAMLKLPINVVALAACAENMPAGNATRPSDTVTSMSGKTVEILNPDAEGRLLLCDALTYAERFEPDVVVDVATLTGASLAAVGRHYSAMFTHDDELSAQLIEAGEMAMDKVWRLPLSEEDLEQLDSQFADIANMGDGTAACVVAALFLSQFVRSFRWVHLDVSGTAKIHGEDIGATGRPVSLLLQYLLTQARLAD